MQHKRYRIENFLTQPPGHAAQPAAAHALRGAVPQSPDIDSRRFERGAAELAAAMEAIEKACALILGTAEHVDEQARAISSAARSNKTRALARGIQDQMVRVYELCNFQDIAGQRIAKVVRLLTGEPEPMADNDFADHGHALVNGPRLDGASGHVTQEDVDALFGYG